MKISLELLWMHLLLACVPTESIFAKPKIETKNGHLILGPAYGRNLTIVISSIANFNINGFSFQNVVDELKNKKAIGDQTSAVSSNNLMNELNEVKLRVLRLEAVNLTNIVNRPIPPISPLFRGVTRRVFNALRTRVNNMQREVSRITRLMQKDECKSTPCSNGGTCLDIFNGFICLCPKNWEGPQCNIDVNECAHFIGTDLGCRNGATCINSPGSYNCTCPPGFYGIHCAEKSNDCNSASSQELCGHGACTTSGNGIKCICDPGWKTDGVNPPCNVDINECETRDHRCSVNPNVMCINYPGGYTCGPCPLGYTGDGYACIDIDECKVNNGDCSTNPLVECHNTLGSRMCGLCPPGYTGNGIICQLVGLCQVNNGGCHPMAMCISTPGMGSVVQCVCKDGYIGNGYGTNGCTLSTSNGTVAVRQPQLFPSFHCVPGSCVHGICHDTSEGYICICDVGYLGPSCNETLKCSKDSCLNGGTCVEDASSSIHCICTALFKGDKCNIAVNDCGDNLSGVEGYIEYTVPRHFMRFNDEVECKWTVITDLGKGIRIQFTKFNLTEDEETETCIKNYLKIKGADSRFIASKDAKHFGEFCGTDLPYNGNLTLPFNKFELRLHSTLPGDGFSLHWKSIDIPCGGNINVESHGSIRSPDYPKNYPSNQDCYWRFTAPFGKRIQFHSFPLHIGTPGSCSNDFLKFYNGLEESQSSILREICHSGNIDPILSSSNTILVYFHSNDDKTNDSGFQISYSIVEGIPGCGGLYTRDVGEISSPTENGEYISNVHCEYQIKLPLGTRIKLTFTEFDLENSVDCMFDNVAIYDGDEPSSPILSRSCGETHPGVVQTSSNEALVVFTADHSLGGHGFKIKYEIVCSYVMMGLSGEFKSPNYPEAYPSSRICSYSIEVPPGYAIKLSFIDFDIEANSYPECNYDYVVIYDGHDKSASLLGKYCGTSDMKPEPSISSHNRMYIEFETDKSVSGTGFHANYSAIELGCGGLLTQNSATVEFPNMTIFDKYEHNKICQWVIVAPMGYAVQLSWINFDLEITYNCDGDYVEIYDNKTAGLESEKIGRFCGHEQPPTLTSSSNMITIKFKSDGSVAASGFSFSYNLIDTKKLCGGNFYTSEGVIMSPGWPEEYPPRKTCEWTITAPKGQQLTLNFSMFDLEKHSNCRSDYLEIRNGGYKNAPLIGKYCGNTIPNIPLSMTNSLYLKFVSDYSRHGGGFYIRWDGTSSGCGGILTSPHGTIISPNYPQPYYHNAQCHWKVSVNPGSVIDFVIADMDLEAKLDCFFDYVAIYDGDSANSASLGKFCSSTGNPGHIRTTSNHAFIRFRTDNHEAGHGFMLHYHSVCQENITGFSGVIESPGYPEQYTSNIDCTWTVLAPIGNIINVTFSSMDISKGQYPLRLPFRSFMYRAETTSCDFDYVQLKDGKDSEYTKKYCGNTTPPMYSTKDNQLFVHMKSDMYFESTGFRLEWKIHGCGGILSRPSGSFTSPGYPKQYSNGIECNWLIQIESGESIELNIMDLDVEMGSQCIFDYLAVYDGPSKSSNLLMKSCHDTHHIVTSSGNSMFVKFVTDESRSGKGFAATYKTVASKCGGKFKANRGVITSPNYPKNYDLGSNCQYFIEVPINHIVFLSFIDFDIDNSKYFNCSDSVKVYDGHVVDEKKLIGQYCGNIKPENITASSNKLLVQLLTDETIAAKGFKAQFSMACGARLKVTGNAIQMVNSHTGLNALSQIDNSMNCTWILESENPVDKISLTLTELHLGHNIFPEMNEGENNCSHQSVEVYNGDSPDAPLIGKYCENESPPTIISLGNALTVVLELSGLRIKGQFSFTYSLLSTTCGGKLGSERGLFSSPRYPDSYTPNSDCVWIMKTSPGNRASLSFNEFSVRSTENCDEDYLEIREGNMTGNILGIFCGDEAPANITASNALWIKFHSSPEGYGKGFIGTYAYLHGNEIENNHGGSISSPMYPLFYFDTGEFVWRITTAYGSFIRITFKEFFIESFGTTCYHSLTIYDGYDETAPVLYDGCGYEIPNTIKTTSNIAYLKFVSASLFYGNRFLLNWIALPKEDSGESLAETKDGKNCGGNETVHISLYKSVNVASPGYPEGYAENQLCEWIYSTDPGSHLAIRFLDISLEESPNCVSDAVTVLSGSDDQTGWKEVKKVCLSNETLAVTHTGALMKVVFKSDISVNKTGFAAVIHSVCGGSLGGPNGVINYKPNIAISILNNMIDLTTNTIVCEWNVTVRSGRTIKVEFTDLRANFSVSSECSNYVMLRNGLFPDSPLLGKGKYCGSETPRDRIETTGNRLFIRSNFNKFSSRTNGFSLSYMEQSINCDQDISLTNDNNYVIIASPNYPEIPNPHSECMWTIKAPLSERLRIDFVDRFDLTSDANCAKEFVEVLDGSTELADSLGKFCTSKPAATIKSTRNRMSVKFFTNAADPKNGFKANVSIDVCGYSIISQSGHIASPSLVKLAVLNTDVECVWNIVAPFGRQLSISVNELRIYDNPLCDQMSLQLFNVFPNKTQSSLTKKMCGTSLLHPIYQANSNEAIIKFNFKKNSNINDNYKFSISFNSSATSCTRTIIASKATLTSVPSCRYTIWKITSPEGTRIKAEVKQLHESESVSFYNDHQISFFIKTISGSLADKTAESSRNIMMITGFVHEIPLIISFTSDNTSVCQGGFEGKSGTINPPEVYDSTYYCEYKFTNDIGPEARADITNQTLVLNVRNARLSYRKVQQNYCFAFSRIEVVAQVGKLASLCGNYSDTQTILSPYRSTTLKLIKMKTPMEYTIDYRVMPCGGIITNVANFTRLALPTNYTGPLHCAWSFSGPVGSTLQAQLNNIQLAGDCSKEYLWFKKGISKPDVEILQYCKDQQSNTVISDRNMLWIEYHTNTLYPSTKLDINITISTACGGTYSRLVPITSPNFPKIYSENQDCEWILSTQKGYQILLSFVSRFSLQTSPNCTKDFVEIFDAVDDSYVSLGKACGRTTPAPLRTSANKVMIRFKSDASVNGDGFKLMMKPVCGGIFNAKETPAVLTSPNYPRYRPNLKCIYNITAPEEKFIALNFTNFLLENGTSSNCIFDNLTIVDAVDGPSSIYCGSKSPGFRRFKNKVDLIFATDTWINTVGFALYYSIDVCGGVIKTPTMISTIRTDNKYHSNMNCVWNITAPPGHNVVLRFEMMVLEFDTYCTFDSVSVFEGLSQNETQRLALLCGNQSNHLPTIKTQTNQMTVLFKSNSYEEHDGFSAAVFFKSAESAGCGGRIDLDQNEKILNIFDRAPYGSYEECQWIVKTTPSKVIGVRFISFDVAPCFNSTAENACSCDSLEVRDGGSITSPLIGKFCGNSTPAEIVSSSSRLWIRFTSDGVSAGRGIKIVLKPQETVCGDTTFLVTDRVQEFKTPGYDGGNIPRGIRCVYRFISNDTQFFRVHLRFIDMDLGPSQATESCSDYLQVSFSEFSNEDEDFGGHVILKGNPTWRFYGGDGESKYCEQMKGGDIYTHERQIYLLVATTADTTSKHKGLKLEYSTIECDRNFTGDQGHVQVYAMGEATNCDIYISTSINKTITLYVTNPENLMFLSDCEKEYAEFLDGDNTTAIAKLCENKRINSVQSTKNTLHIHVAKASYISMFNFIYTTTDKDRPCGGELNFQRGVVMSPSYPKPYRVLGECVWTITTITQTNIKLKFKALDLGPPGTCGQNYLEIVQNEDDISKFCPGDKADVIRMNANKAKIIFHSSKNMGDGFLIAFTGGQDYD